MPEYDDLFDDDNDNVSGSDLVKQLRNALKQEKRERKAEQDQLRQLLSTNRAKSLADVLKEKGVSEKAAGLYPSDRETTAEAVAEWLGEYGDIFGIERQETTATPETRQAAQTISSVAATAPPSSTSFDVNSIIAEIKAAKTPAELAAAYEKAGLK